MLFKDESTKSTQITHLFTLRMWLEELGSGEVGWRGKVQHVNSGEVRYFQDWSVMLSFVKKQLGEINSLQTISAEAEETSITKEENTSR